MRLRSLLILVVVFSVIVISSFWWNSSLIISNNEKVVNNKSQAFFSQIVISRAWNALHKGVYVPVTEITKSNPYLVDPVRDVVTEDGMQLTKVNPAYMTRQIAELNNSKDGLRFHITSLNPLRPENVADDWEMEALKSFENGNPEILELVQSDSIASYRYMAPLITTNSCLKCHSDQGYKLGDIRGGISVSFPSEIYMSGVEKQILSLALIHFLIFLVGIIGLLVYYKLGKNYIAIIAEKNKELVQINATKDKFFSIIAHDLRSPFTSLLGLSELLLMNFEVYDSPTKKKHINAMNNSMRKTYNLLEDLLLWARTQSDKIIIKKEKLLLRTLIIEATEAYYANAERKNITISNKISDEFIINADKFTIKTVIANVFNNAIKFTPKDGTIEFFASKNSGFAEITISDSGVGIPQKKISRLFHMEESVTTLGTENEKGTGLGLLLCKEFVEKNNGRIWIESEEGVGTKIKIALPE